MARVWTKTEAFEHFGVVLENVRWSWSGVSRDGSAVAVVLWQDGIKRHDGNWVYNDVHDLDAEWRNGIGNRRRIQHLSHTRDNLAGRFQVIVAKAVDLGADPRQIEKCFPQLEGYWMLAFLDETTGAFRASMIG